MREALIKESTSTVTENGQYALNTSGEKCLDFFSTVGALRNADENRITRLFEDAYNENPLIAVKTVFYARDIRGGAKIGERRVFRILIKYMAKYHTEVLKANLNLIPFYGRWDDLYELIGTPLEDDMWELVKRMLELDKEDMFYGRPISLLAKWLKSADASSRNTRKLGIYTALHIGYSVQEYKKTLRVLRRYIDVVESRMSRNEWDEIDYSKVPSKAMLNYRNAFFRHDEERFEKYVHRVINGEEKINADLYPYDIMEKCFNNFSLSDNSLSDNEKDLIEAEWENLPDYVGNQNAIVIADTSGSMWGRPMCTSLGLAIYFAQRNKGAFHDLWMSFSENPHIHEIKGKTIFQILSSINTSDWGMNTNLFKAFRKILDVAVKNHISSDEMPKSLIVISDMEIDMCTDGDWTFYDAIKRDFAEEGYELPNVIFWNVESRHDIFHADSTRKGVQLVSGQSAGTFKLLMDSIGLTPIECMNKALSDERYNIIKEG